MGEQAQVLMDRFSFLILHECLAAINKWMSQNFLQLNADKTEILIIGPDKISNTIQLSLGSLAQNVTKTAKNPWYFL